MMPKNLLVVITLGNLFAISAYKVLIQLQIAIQVLALELVESFHPHITD
jgi:hypothetical protein